MITPSILNNKRAFLPSVGEGHTGKAKLFKNSPCYHTELDTFELRSHHVGIIGQFVGASFAVLVAEELFASGCKLLVSLTSAGQIAPAGSPPYFVVLTGRSGMSAPDHYAAPSEFAKADPELVRAAAAAFASCELHSAIGASWTTDAPFLETAEAIEAAREKGILAVEMEAAAAQSDRSRNAPKASARNF